MLIRLLTGIPLAAITVLFVGLYLAYGQVDPCRVLAVEKARRTEQRIGFNAGDTLENWTRLETSQMSTGECASGLLDSWGERLDRAFRKDA